MKKDQPDAELDVSGFVLDIHLPKIGTINNSSGTLRAMNKVFLHVVINVRPGKYQDFVTQLKDQVTEIRNEPGCEYIEIFQNDQQADVVHVYETWSDRSAWDAHVSNDKSKGWQRSATKFAFSETISILNKL